jgi:hypothetical protein
MKINLFKKLKKEKLKVKKYFKNNLLIKSNPNDFKIINWMINAQFVVG